MSRSSIVTTLAFGLGLGLAGCGTEDSHGVREDLLGSLMEAQDARGNGPEGLGPIQEALSSSNSELQVLAVRALGRLEDPEQIPRISALLEAADSEVRAEAVNALGQAVFGEDGEGVAELLLHHLSRESDPNVRGVLGRTMGRLRYSEPGGIQTAESALLGLTMDGSGGAPMPTLLGAVLGLEWLTRQNRGVTLAPETISRLEELTSYGLAATAQSERGGQTRQGGRAEPGSEEAARVRRVALSALTAGGAVRERVFLDALADSDEDVRRLVVAALGRFASSEEEKETLAAALDDPSPRVRMQAVVAFGALAPVGRRCDGLLGAASDENTLVAEAALDLLGEPCPVTGPQIEALTALVRDPDASTSAHWHRGAHALLALAGVAPEEASSLIPGLAGHRNPFARAYAARAAARTGDVAILEVLAEDQIPNVRTAATQGLFRLRGHAVDDLLLSQLSLDDPQLLLTVAGFLEGTPDPGVAAVPLLQTFLRISARNRETLRDPRMAVLNRLGEVVGAGLQEDVIRGLDPFLADYDPLVAGRVAELLTEWTGEVREASPEPLAREAVPTPEELNGLSDARVILELDGGGEIEIRLFPHLAPTNAARFAELARSGALDGLTFHRVVPNFVLQGGSPGANEMAGHGSYTRDEIGLQSNWRGTVGTSTRGRDTGDGQFFINLVDNLRLDHNYTIFGEVSAGMDGVDRVVEGQVILRARVVDE